MSLVALASDMYMQLEENTCIPITQYAYKQSSHFALLGKHTWSWV